MKTQFTIRRLFPAFVPVAFAGAFLAFGHAAVSCSHKTTPQPEWELVWSDDFTEGVLDTTVWRLTDRGEPDWANTQSHDPRCIEFRDGMVVLRGIVNDDTITDPSPYLTGGIWTRDKKRFAPGRFEVRARLHGAQGAWPAIWLLPYDKATWPGGGEIDILERLNNDSIAYQTVHSDWTYTLGHEEDPKHGFRPLIDRDEFNVYGVDMYPDSIVFHINGVRTGMYPKVNDGADGQFPFMRDQQLLIDMQLGGNWVGEVNPADLPVEMEVDWVKHYVLKE